MNFNLNNFEDTVSFENIKGVDISSDQQPNQDQPKLSCFFEPFEEQNCSMEEAQVVPDFKDLIEGFDDNKRLDLTDNVFESEHQTQSLYENCQFPRERMGSSDSEDLDIYLKPCVLTPTPVERLYSTLDIAETTLFKFPPVTDTAETKIEQPSLMEILKSESYPGQSSICEEADTEFYTKRTRNLPYLTGQPQAPIFFSETRQSWDSSHIKNSWNIELCRSFYQSDISPLHRAMAETSQADSQIPNFPPSATSLNRLSEVPKINVFSDFDETSTSENNNIEMCTSQKQTSRVLSHEKLSNFPQNLKDDCCKDEVIKQPIQLLEDTSLKRNDVTKLINNDSPRNSCKSTNYYNSLFDMCLQNCKIEKDVNPRSPCHNKCTFVTNQEIPCTLDKNAELKTESTNIKSVHNDTEKQRRDNMKMKLRQLRLVVPELENCEKVSKIIILRCAQKYICQLKNEMEELEQIKLREKTRNEELFSKLLSLTNS